MANNAFNFKGIYDKIVGLLKSDAIQPIGDYVPSSNDYVAIYKDVPGSAASPSGVIAVKEYVSVTDIGTGGGGGGGGSMSSFQVTGQGGVTLSLDGSTYSNGPLTVENANNLRVSATSVPSGLNWEGQWSNSTTYQLNDVVSNVVDNVYTTWFYINATPSSGNALPTAPATSNTYWAQLGTQGPPGAIGPAGANGAAGVAGFRTLSVGTTAWTLKADAPLGTPGLVSGGDQSTPNTTDVGVFITTSSTTPFTLTVPANLTNFPVNYQITIMQLGTGQVQIATDGTSSIVSANNMRYLRTQNSAATLIKKSTTQWYLFGDLTNVVI
jgi:hypothetical protein